MNDTISTILFAADAGKAAPSVPVIRLRSGSAIYSLAVPAATGGAFSLYRWDLAESTTGPSPHLHRTFGESFYVLSGELSFYAGDAWRVLAPGDFAYAPAGAVHGFWKATGQTASVLMLFTPAVARHEYFTELLDHGDSMTAAEETRFHQRHDNHFPPAADGAPR